MEELKDQIMKMVAEEYERALKAYGLNHSQHEGYAVLLEEIEEAEDEMVEIKSEIIPMWSDIKNNETNEAEAISVFVEGHAIELACEAVQVAAMARKFREREGENE